MSQIPPPPPPNWQTQQYQQPPVPQQYAAPPYVATPATWPYGGFWIRFVAYLLDGIIISVPLWTVIAIFAGGMIASFGDTTTEEQQIAAAAAAGFTIFMIAILALVGMWLYEALMTSSERGATLGKRALGLRIVRSDGTRLSFGRATGRFFAKIFITGMIPFGIGYMMAGFTDRKRALHDMIADTVVVKV